MSDTKYSDDLIRLGLKIGIIAAIADEYLGYRGNGEDPASLAAWGRENIPVTSVSEEKLQEIISMARSRGVPADKLVLSAKHEEVIANPYTVLLARRMQENMDYAKKAGLN